MAVPLFLYVTGTDCREREPLGGRAVDYRVWGGGVRTAGSADAGRHAASGAVRAAGRGGAAAGGPAGGGGSVARQPAGPAGEYGGRGHAMAAAGASGGEGPDGGVGAATAGRGAVVRWAGAGGRGCLSGGCAVYSLGGTGRGAGGIGLGRGTGPVPGAAAIYRGWSGVRPAVDGLALFAAAVRDGRRGVQPGADRVPRAARTAAGGDAGRGVPRVALQDGGGTSSAANGYTVARCWNAATFSSNPERC